MIYYAITKFQPKSTKRNKTTLILLTRGPHMAVEQIEQRGKGAPLLCLLCPVAHGDAPARARRPGRGGLASRAARAGACSGGPSARSSRRSGTGGARRWRRQDGGSSRQRAVAAPFWPWRGKAES